MPASQRRSARPGPPLDAARAARAAASAPEDTMRRPSPLRLSLPMPPARARAPRGRPAALVPALASLLFCVSVSRPLRAADAPPTGDAGSPPESRPEDAPASQAPSDNQAALDDLFGDALPAAAATPAGPGLREVASTIAGGARSNDLSVKDKALATNVDTSLIHAFAAERIVLHPKEGCIAAPPGSGALRVLELARFPGVRPGFAACLRLRSTAARPMVLAVFLVDARNHRVARASDQIDFSTRGEVDHVLTFPPVQFQRMGTHSLVVDLDGREVGRVPLFEVRTASAGRP